MPQDDGEISFRLQFPGGDSLHQGWPCVQLRLGDRVTLSMVPNLLAPRSAITLRTFERLHNLGIETGRVRDFRTRRPICPLNELSIDGHAVPDVQAFVRSNLPFLRADGYLGLDFFGQFANVCFQPDDLIVSLRPRA